MPPAPRGVRISYGPSLAPVDSGIRLIQFSVADREAVKSCVTHYPETIHESVGWPSWTWPLPRLRAIAPDGWASLPRTGLQSAAQGKERRYIARNGFSWFFERCHLIRTGRKAFMQRQLQTGR